MKTFFVTIAANMPMGCGYWEIHAQDEAEARQLAFAHCPEGRWSFMYPKLEDVHPMDRKRHGSIGKEPPTSWREDLGTQGNIGTGTRP